MKIKIKKALDLAVSNLSNAKNWLSTALKRSDVKILASFDNEQEVAKTVERIKSTMKSFRFSHFEPNCYYEMYNRHVESGSFCLSFGYFINGYRECEWYFFGDRNSGIKKMCLIQIVNDQEELLVYELPLKDEYECDGIYNFANDVLQAFIIEPHLFEAGYDFQVLFFGNDKDIQYDVKYLAEYERVDI